MLLLMLLVLMGISLVGFDFRPVTISQPAIKSAPRSVTNDDSTQPSIYLNLI